MIKIVERSQKRLAKIPQSELIKKKKTIKSICQSNKNDLTQISKRKIKSSSQNNITKTTNREKIKQKTAKKNLEKHIFIKHIVKMIKFFVKEDRQKI